MNKVIPVITIDGPSGSGKGTLSRKLANDFGWNLLDSGIIYRILAKKALLEKIDINNEKQLLILISNMKIDFINIKNEFFIFCNNQKINNNIYTEFIGNFASRIAMSPNIRQSLLVYQRKYCVSPGLIADGRDMGTIVFPNAIIKFFLYATYTVRKRRRLKQLRKINFNIKIEDLVSQIKERNERDYARKIAPLIPAADALVLNSTELSEIEVINKMKIYIKKKLT